MPDRAAALSYAEDHQTEFLEALKELLRIPSISTLPEHEGDMRRAAEWIGAKLSELGFESVAVMPTEKHPVVFGEWLKAGPSAPTILVYGHYDVQPADPLELWESDPFEPVVQGDDLFARGASDMKGQLVANLAALESNLHAGGLPVNIKYMVEGEEEIGSPSIEQYLKANRDLLRGDFCLNVDSSILSPDTPSITYALRGLAYFELWVYGPASDLHSGMFGGAVNNPANVLADLIAGMRDEDGRITLPGFYDKVRPLDEDERADLAKLPQPDAWWLDQTGAEALFGDPDYTVIERVTARPTLDVNGLLSGFTGEGSKTVLPAKAMAKISTRLVADQQPEAIDECLRAYLERNAPPSVRWALKNLASAKPSIVERDSVAVRAASAALERVWGKRPLFNRSGGTIAVVGLIQELLGVDTLLLGFGLPDDNLHAPNEKLHLPNFHKGISTYIHLMHEIVG